VIFGWLKRRRRRRLLAGPFPAGWLPYLEGLPLYSTLTRDERAYLQRIVRVLVAEKSWEGCGGLVVTEEMQVVIAAQAALLVLGLEVTDYPRVHSILVYPSTFVVSGRIAAAGPGVHAVSDESQAMLGEAWTRGPVVLAWDAARRGGVIGDDGRNLVLHEFAHKLDMRDDVPDGTPILRDGKQYESWNRVMTAEYERLVARTESGRPTLLDKYGASEPAEFFAVATECFFEKANKLRKKRPELYELLRTYFGQDPAARG
jgi:Mlc titration factor MtfA (ptsG expression regulator)